MVGLVTVGMSVPSLVGAAPQAQAAMTPIVSQSYVKLVGLDLLKKQGLDGSGVTIALFDGAPDLTVPELAGANVTVKKLCDDKTPSTVHHGTAVLSILANKTWGWAPKAKFLVYAISYKKDETSCSNPISNARMLNQALDDGADIVSISEAGGSGEVQDWGYAVARATLKGVPVVAAVGNSGMDSVEADDSDEATTNAVIGVGADDLKGQRAKYSDYGAGLTIMAPGTITCRDPDSSGKLTVIDKDCHGTSFATPIVSGALALAMQKWPRANGNQLISSLLATAVRSSDKWNEKTGWGNFNPTKLMSNDPSQYSTDNPLMDKMPPPKHGLDPVLDQQMLENYRDGLADPQWIFEGGDDEYIYRGTDPKILAEIPADRAAPGTSPRSETSTSAPPGTPSASVPASPASHGSFFLAGFPLLPFVGGGIGVVVIVTVVVVVVAVRGRKSSAASVPVDREGG